MNFRKLLILTSMSLAVIAVAAPASASAESVFTVEGTPIEHEGEASVALFGSFGWGITGTENGWHCEEAFAEITLGATGTGTVDNFEADDCTTTPSNFQMHAQAMNLPWTVHAVDHHTIEITDIHVNNKVTHPETPHLVVAESTLTGNVDATVPVGQTHNIQTATLSGTGPIHMGGSEVFASVSGHLEKVAGPQIGIGTVETRR